MAACAGVLGLFLLSSGVSLVVQSSAQGSPGGHIPVLVCHATGSDSNPYVAIFPDADSTKLQGHQAHRDHPNKTWKSAGWWNGTYYSAGSPKRDYIHSYTDANSVFHQEDGNITAGFCTAPMTKYLSVTPAVSFTDPTCDVSTGDWSGQAGTGIAGYAVTSGDTTAGDSILITATAAAHYTFSANPNTLVATQDFPHTYGPVPETCVTTSPTETVTPPPSHPGTTVGTIPPSFRAPACPSTQAAVNLGNQGFLNAADLAATNNKFGVAGVIYTVTGTVAPGGSITVTATPADPTVPITAGQPTSWSHTFGKVHCTLPPPTHPKTVVPTVVHSGLTAVSADRDGQRRELGVGLAISGVVLLMGSVGLLRRRS